MSTADPPPNGALEHTDDDEAPKSNEERIAQLEQELEKTRAESDNWAEQYRTLLAKLTTMRTTLANKLKQDAEELDRREQHITQLTATNDDLSNAVETLKQELTAASDDASHLSRELSALRQRALDNTSSADAELEQTRLELEHTRGDLEATRRELEGERIEREELEREAAHERVMADEVKAQVGVLRREVEQAAALRARDLEAVEREKEKSTNLQSVLEDFQLAKDMEIRQALAESESSLQHTIKQLAEFKSRALQAEARSSIFAELAESTHNSECVTTLEREVKEKNLLIGKLRHEDTTRFEMLGVLANVLGWGDNEREKAGLQRSGTGSGFTLGVPGVGIGARRASSSGSKDVELDRSDETESFSKMWVEFLLKEANQGSVPPTPTTPGPVGGAGSPLSRPISLPGLPTISRSASRTPSRDSTSGADSPTTATPPRLSMSSLSRSSLGLGVSAPKRSDAASPLSRTGDEA
ncbi:hypothetical protein FRC07_000683 [Ceratobasidium sp. 392]|nr:hypothetical protein FRC07_000683 [Ceratobasidium sp. 392]